MASSGIAGIWARLKATFIGAIAQDCPPEMAACEVCRRTHCSSAEWVGCEKRLAAERLLRSGDQVAIEELRTAHRCGCERPGAGGVQKDGAAC